MSNYELAPKTEPQRQEFFIARGKELLSNIEKKIGRHLTCCVTTFGCQMNARDSEKLLGILEKMGYVSTESEKADLVIYNTCTVRENADNRVFGRLGILNNYKKKNPHMRIGICGCMMQEEHIVEKINKSYPFVDIMFGTHNIHVLAELVVKNLEEDVKAIDIWDEADGIVEDLPVDRKYKFKSGINITFGCNNFCSYCIVPYVRGRERSRSPKAIIREIEKLVADGVVEVMLLGQNVNSYGKGLEDEITFPELLREVDKIEGLKRIRFMTPHPKDLSDDLIDAIAESKHVCHHIHLPLQSGSSEILRKMNRRYDKEKYLGIVKKIRERIPDCSITTDIIVGFPGETEEDFLETMDVVKRVRYDSAFTFQYSKRTGTPAAKMEEQIPQEVVTDRFDRLLKEVQTIAHAKTKELEGKVVPVLCETVNHESEGLMSGRLENNAVVHFKGDSSMIGKIFNVKLDEANGFYYMGSIVE
ncbi:MAG: tRNA (N6-isopentenyl adenosine(37)-C2)-methylthiotransferase MiaB [Lachnospiraceae bacterium]|nr:tRNA (N6-isopentenyl adenosine(37)-C2)-methylthiotransferase MiaB [Lachnospiraceae bacterium]